jgi:hypothetical protein
MYRNLVQHFLGYIDCYLRLSAMAKASEHILHSLMCFCRLIPVMLSWCALLFFSCRRPEER